MSSEPIFYSLTWERDIECPLIECTGVPCTPINKDFMGNYNITDLEEGSTYEIVLQGDTLSGRSSSITVTATTLEAGERNLMLINTYLQVYIIV